MHRRFFPLIVLLLGVASPAFAQGTAFTYHGRLNENGIPANGSYDLTFSVFDAPNLGNQIGSPLTITSVGVSAGLFTTLLDFGPGIFVGPDRWLEIGVRTNGASNFAPLTPRQRLAPAPYAIMANTASNLLGTLPVSQLSGTLADSQLPANIPRLDGSGNFTGTVSFNNPASSFVGSGSGLTALDASRVASGTLPDTRLSDNVAFRNAHQTFTGSNLFSGAVQLTNTDNTLVGTFSGDGAGLIRLNPANLMSGTALIDVSGNAATATWASAVPWSGISGIPASLADGVDNDTTYTAGPGLLLNGTEFRVEFAGNGVAVQAARSDHDHGGIYAAYVHTHSGAEITSGTLADARLSSNVALHDAHQSFSGSNTFDGVLSATNTNNVLNGTFAGIGSNLTGLNPANLGPGTADINISGNAATAVTAATANSFTGLLTGDVTGAQAATVVARVGGLTAAQIAGGASAANAATTANAPDTLVRRDSEGNFTAGNITVARVVGDGSGLAGLNASQVASGTLDDARLSDSVALRSAHQTFIGSNLFSGAVQMTNPDNTLVGTFSGDGAGLSNLVVIGANLQGPITTTQLSGPLPSSLLAGTYNNALTFRHPANSFTGNGAGLIGVNATTLGGLGAAGFWQMGGNAGTSPEVNFLGTTDNQPVEIRANSQRALRIEPNINDAPNMIGGASVNRVDLGVIGATISGGGAASYFGDAYPNHIAGDFAVIGGGLNNTSGGVNSTVSGGSGNSANGAESTVGGGVNNTSSGGIATVGGGAGNTSSGFLATVSGGTGNTSSADFSTVGGGLANTSSGFIATVGGGAGNDSAGYLATVAGGDGNTGSGSHSAVGGGAGNTASEWAATVAGGHRNSVTANYGTIPGGAEAMARSHGQMAYASGSFAQTGDAQTSVYVCRGVTADAIQTDLFLDGSAARMIMPTNSTWSFEILITGRASSGDSAGYQISGVIANNNGTTALVGNLTKNVLAEDVRSWDATVVADDVNDALLVSVTGTESATIRWVASSRTVETTY